jgi:hypothetical protein
VAVRQDFTAINIVEKTKIKSILERGAGFTKVRISVVVGVMTHACFEPNELVKFIPW